MSDTKKETQQPVHYALANLTEEERAIFWQADWCLSPSGVAS